VATASSLVILRALNARITARAAACLSRGIANTASPKWTASSWPASNCRITDGANEAPQTATSIGVTEVVVIESWRVHDNTVRPHASLGYKPPAPEVFVPGLAARSAAQRLPASPAALPLAPRPQLPRPLRGTDLADSLMGWDGASLSV
jgi:hypothetical protein